MKHYNVDEKGLEIVKLGIDEYKQVPVANFSTEKRNEAIRGKFFEIFGTETPDELDYQENKYKVFRIIREVLRQAISQENGAKDAFYTQFVDERNLALGDKNEFEIENDAYLTVGKISGNNWDLNRQRVDQGEVITLPMSAFYIKVFDYFKRFMAGRMDWNELLAKMEKSVQKHKSDFIYDSFKKAFEGLPQGFTYTGSYVENEILKVISNVKASNNGTAVTIVGTEEALARLQGSSTNLMSDKMKQEFNDKGFLTTWKTYNCVALPTVFNENTFEFAFDNDSIYVLPTDVKPVKLVNEGDVLISETDVIDGNKDMTRERAIIWRMGAGVIFNKLFGKVKLTA